MDEYTVPSHIQTLHRDIEEHQLRYHTKRVSVSKAFHFDAAHHLHCYEGKCKSLHGHTYTLEFMVSGIPDERGIVVDFGELKSLFERYIGSRLDHRYLNEVVPPMNTTAENLVVWMWEQLVDAVDALCKPRSVQLEQLILYETKTSYAMAKREWMNDGQ
ncbi:MAG: 6-carboxytetrahydropterin synthase QueD [Alicyclobacillaceae bacterium]|jgi:6-pyruvoyltetrahydropterin/6-carboxytetrahydropterin synthase|nr:6-carboxytetrahydropterin synthase QueD [Alicyclobacillaceae bacterium]MCY0895812.1 6-carboxytetrahydropterin synthase QueD [Alicyclobacillaceae bacterium]